MINRFKISVTRNNTGETSEMLVQAPFDLTRAKDIANYMVDLTKFTITNIVQIHSVVKISIEPFCLN